MVYDSDRIMFLRNYLTMLQRANAEGVPVHGYFLWSLFDNFEWADGYNTRFGLIHVDYATQTHAETKRRLLFGRHQAQHAGLIARRTALSFAAGNSP